MRRIVLILLLVSLTSFISNRKVDEQKIIQKCFDIKTVMMFFHEKPVIILDNGKISNRIKVIKYEQPVLFMTENELREKNIKAFVVFHKLNIKKDFASVYFRLDSQGMGAEIKLKKQKGEWLIIDEKIYEN